MHLSPPQLLHSHRQLRRFHFLIQSPNSFNYRQFSTQMRTNRSLFQSPAVSRIAAIHFTSAAAAPEIEHSPWRSPVPYLFGGLAAMLGLIAFALLLLACAYWKLFGEASGGEERDAERAAAEEKIESGLDAKELPAFEEKFLVIMAGDVKPTFLATPVLSSRAAAAAAAFHENSNQTYGKEAENPNLKNQHQTDVIIIHENGESSQEHIQN